MIFEMRNRSAQSENSELISAKEAAEILGLTRQRIGQLAHELPHFETPIGRLFWKAQIQEIAKTRKRWARRAPTAA